MSLTKTIDISGHPVTFKASAAIPRIYRIKFQRDIYKDLAVLDKAIAKSDADHSDLDIPSLEVFENISYVMAKHADPAIPDSVEDWLDQFDTFSIYQILPEIIELWGLNTKTESESKKKFIPPNVR